MLSLLVTLLIVAIVLWIVSMIPMDAKAKQIVQVAVAVILLLWLVLVLLGYAPRLDVR
jgi:hypothetical protein